MIRAMSTALLASLFLGSAGAQAARTPDGSQLLRVYLLLDRQHPERIPEDTAVSMTLQSRSGRGETFLLARVAKAPADGGVGAIRGLVGSPYFVEVVWPGGGPKSAPSEDALRRAHQGPCFVANVPSSRIPEATSATVTVRRGESTWSSEEVQGPARSGDAEETAIPDLERALRTIQDRAASGASFMMVKPAVEDLHRALARLAPAGFRDPTGAFEQERQWCLAMARAIDDACAYGKWGQIQNLSLSCGPRVKRMESMEAAPRAPEIPTIDHRD
jgi:hypothetical protein